MLSASELIFSVFVYNVVFGSGVLLLPKAFWNVGYILGTALLLFLAVVSWASCVFVIEALSIANYKHFMNTNGKITRHNSNSEDRTNESHHTDESFNQSLLPATDVDACSEYDKFNINKKYEVAEMAKLFFGRGMLIVFYSLMMLYLYGDLCIYLSVVGTTLRGLACPISQSRVNVLNETCTELGSANVFRIFSSSFFIITAPFVFTNLKKSVGIQLTTMFLRLLAVATMIACASIRISKNSSHDIEKVRLAGIPNFFGICLYSFMCQHSLPNMVNYVTKKSAKFNYFILFSMIIALVLYLLTVFTATFSFEGEDIQAIYSMNFSEKNSGWFYEFLYYYLMLFPTIALSASYPIIAITLRENIITLTEIILDRPLNENVKNYLYPLLAIFPSYIFVTIMPDSVSMIANIVGAYAGSFVQYFIPACLIIWARKKIKKEFGDIDLAKNRNSLFIFRNNIIPGLVIGWTFVGIGIVTFYYLTK